MQLNTPVEIVRGLMLCYEGDEVWSLTQDRSGDQQEVVITCEELYDIAQIVFARRPTS